MNAEEHGIAPMNADEHSTFATTLVRWFAANGRQLPWRGTRDAYAIWLSEVILQQTQVAQGRPYWERFMSRWPTVEQLAAASEDEVLREWQGLGYYSRARHLLTAARQVVGMGGFPQTFEGLRRLKGVGDYTAAAIASMAFAQPVAVVDGNVYRVLSRHFGIDTPINTTEGKHLFAQLAQAMLMQAAPQGAAPQTIGRQAAVYNQAVMDFGATLCTPRSPRCDECPLQLSCSALRENQVALLPVKEKKLKVKERRLTYIYLRCHGHTAIHRRGEGDIWQGLWEPLLIENADATDICSQWALQGDAATVRLLKKSVRHVLTHRIILADFYLVETNSRPTLPDGYIWIQERDIDQYAVPRLVEILLESMP